MLSRKSRYALMALTVLAKQYGGDPVPMSSIAVSKNIPLRFLEGILLQLKRAGFLESTRGVDGGYSLIKDPGDVTMLEIVTETEGPLAFVSCLDICNEPKCEFGWELENCGIRKTFADIHEAVIERLRNTTLEDLTASP